MNNKLIASVKLAVFAALFFIPMAVHADKKAWVEYQSDAKTLTFRYDDQKESTEATGKYELLTTTQNIPEWHNKKIALNITKVVFADSFKDARPVCSYAWFDGMTNLTTIEGIENLNTSEMKISDSMFGECSSLTSIDLSHFDTSSLQDAWKMFAGCTSLTSIDLSSFNMDKIEDMISLFDGCTNLRSVILPTAECPQSVRMTKMFNDCSSLQSMDFSGFKVPSVKTMNYMFSNCSSLTSLDLRTFGTSDCTDMSAMFGGCSNLQNVELTSFDTSNVTDASYMFYGCTSLQGLYVSDKFSFSDTCESENMFASCVKLPGYDATKIDKSMANTTDGYLTLIASGAQPWVEYDETSKTLTFRYDDKKTEDDNCYGILDDTSNTPGWLENRENVEKVVFDKAFSYARPVCCYAWFSGMKNLTDIEGIEYLNTSEVTEMFWMFQGCEKLTTLDLRNFNTANVTSMDDMFWDCSSLSKIYVGKTFVLSDECTGKGMFYGCTSLDGYNIDNIGKEMANYDTGYFSKYITTVEPWAAYDDNTQTLTFYYNGEREYSDATLTCLYNLPEDEELYEGPGWIGYVEKITKVVFDKSFADYRPTSCMGLFYGMENLEDIEGIENLNTSDVTTMFAMFVYCGIKSLDLSSFNTSSVTDMRTMFAECENLQALNMSNWDTSKVTSMENMFTYCSSLTSLDISHFDMSANESMKSMFQRCASLKSVSLPQSSTPNVENLSYMFSNCEQIEDIDLSYFTTDNVDVTQYMFYDCSALKHIYVNDKFALSEDCTSAGMFDECTSLDGYNKDSVDITKANYTDGYLTLRRHFTVGDNTYNADGVDAVCYDNVAFGDKDAFASAFDFKFDTDNNAAYERTVSSNWATLCLPFSFAPASNEGVNCYRINTIGTDVITVDKIEDVVAAGEPILVYTATGDISVTGAAGSKVVSAPVTSDYLTGTFAEATVANDAKNYIISKDKFWNVEALISQSGATSVKMAPYRAYIAGQTSDAKAASLDIMTGETDGISSVSAADAILSLDGAELYNAQGRRLAAPERGLVIVKKGGITRKMIVK